MPISIGPYQSLWDCCKCEWCKALLAHTVEDIRYRTRSTQIIINNDCWLSTCIKSASSVLFYFIFYFIDNTYSLHYIASTLMINCFDMKMAGSWDMVWTHLTVCVFDDVYVHTFYFISCLHIVLKQAFCYCNMKVKHEFFAWHRNDQLNRFVIVADILYNIDTCMYKCWQA